MSKRIAEQWTDVELLNYSKTHLQYEINMFLWCGILLQDPAARPLVTPFVRNLIIEGFGIHLRGLFEFFCRLESPHSDDVLAVDYMGAAIWTIPNLSPTAQDAWQRVNKEVGHLTSLRKDDCDPSKGWNEAIEKLIPEVVAICREFVKRADSAKLAEEVRCIVRDTATERARVVSGSPSNSTSSTTSYTLLSFGLRNQ